MALIPTLAALLPRIMARTGHIPPGPIGKRKDASWRDSPRGKSNRSRANRRKAARQAKARR